MDEQDGITAYHGSPHEFDRFDLSEINKKSSHGQNFGHGLYFAENEPTAFEYKKPSFALDSDPQGHMYEVHINAHPDHFLDWDKPLSEQSEHVKNIVGPMMDGQLGITGEKFYKYHFGDQPKYASDYLSKHGIHGIKYVDYKARGKWNPETGNYEDSKHNYVVFDHNRVNIKRRYEEGGRVGFGFGGDTEFAGSAPERGATGSAVAAHEAPQAEAPAERGYRDMPADLQQAQHDLNFKNAQILDAMKETNAADQQHKAEQVTAWAGAGFPAGGPGSMQVGDETRPTAYAMSDISKKSPVMQSQADIIASLAPAAGTPTQGYNPVAQAAGTPTGGYNLAQAAGTPTGGYSLAQAAGTPTGSYNQLAQAAGTPTGGYDVAAAPAPQPIRLASLDSSTFKPASPMPEAPQGHGRRMVKKLMPDGTYQDVMEEYAHGGVAKSYASYHNPAIVEHALAKITAPPPALDPTLMVAKRGRPL